MPRFVILRHETPAGSPRPLHWDLMLESGPALRTWALAEPPVADRAIDAEALPDHRSSYLDYEGPISGNRGTVTRWDAGKFQWERNTPREIVVRLDGRVLTGRLTLARTDETSPSWTALFQPTGRG